ncbi:3-hydroxyacyl-CoA dehydrogenase [Rhodobacter viridis]|uniref:3-hydroxyacyl-CoA dehydrogenase n=1 Tax=Rhodobacter viridis TaxID=1054202 RepID=A0A318TUW5_9RHOB|nr:enoyl-CoA hydratase/isomerase family protein [Rhodobacter viridis]PYF08616.1 3-hydroxyacyl-CoA dehydrogenase [Rhodobacter viridis]
MARRVNVQRRDGVALVTLEGADEGPKGAGFDQPMRWALEAALTEAFETPGLQAIVLRAGDGGWPRALDPAEEYSAAKPTLGTLCTRLAQAEVPVVAVLSGTISGGVLALTQAAGLRLALASTRFHFPESALNLLPAAGGTVRLVRRVGGAVALEALLSGRVFRAEEAMPLGLCDAVASEGTIETAAQTEALRVAALGAEGPFSRRDGALSDPGGALDALAAARTRIPPRADLSAPTRIAQVAEAALLLPLPAALEFEAVAYADLVASETAAALRHLARAQTELQGLAGVPTEGIVPVSRVALWNPSAGRVIALLRRGLAVQIGTSDPARLPPLLTEIARAQEKAAAEGLLDPARREADWARLEPVSGPDAFGPTDLMIAAPTTPEERDTLRRFLPAGAVLALSGTAPGPDELGIDRSQRLAAIWAGTPGQTADLPRLAAVLRAGGMRVIHATAPALRLEAAYFMAADRTVLAGAAPQAVDAALTRWGFAEGPFARFERLGADLAGTRLLAAGRKPGPVLATLAVLGGMAQAAEPLAALRAEAGIAPRSFSEAEIVARILAELAALGIAALESRKAFRPGDIDLMAGAELGFPAHRGGPMFQADRIGPLALRKRLRALEAEGAPPTPALLDVLIRDGQSLAERFA